MKMNAVGVENFGMKRLSKDETFLRMAEELAQQSTCLDKQVGCVITNKYNLIIGTGYNGAPRGYKHCTDLGYCIKEKHGIASRCPSAHAEQNALIQCKHPNEIWTVYTTLSPCISCIRMILNTTAERIVFRKEHIHPEPRQLWHAVKQGRRNEWILLIR